MNFLIEFRWSNPKLTCCQLDRLEADLIRLTCQKVKTALMPILADEKNLNYGGMFMNCL